MGSQRIPQVTRLGTGCGFMFLTPFLLVGVGACGFSWYRLVEWIGMREWQACPATILRVEQTRGDESTGVEAEYEYTWQGQRHTGERVALHDLGKDNIGPFQRDLYRRLSRLQGRAGAAQCFVNSADASESVLSRDPRWEMFAFFSLFSGLFGSVGLLGMLGIGLAAGSTGDALAGSGTAAESSSAAGSLTEIVSDNSGTLKLCGAAAVWWILTAVPPGAVSLAQLTEGRWGALAGLIPGVVAVVLLRTMKRRWQQRRRVGRMTLQLQEPVLRRGETAVAGLLLERRVDVTGPVRLQLRVRRMQNEWLTVEESTIEPHALPTQVLAGQSLLGLRIPVPDDRRTESATTWQLRIRFPVAGAGVPISGTFVLPVESWAAWQRRQAPDAADGDAIDT